MNVAADGLSSAISQLSGGRGGGGGGWRGARAADIGEARELDSFWGSDYQACLKNAQFGYIICLGSAVGPFAKGQCGTNFTSTSNTCVVLGL